MTFTIGIVTGCLLYPRLKEMYKKPEKKHRFFLRPGRDY